LIVSLIFLASFYVWLFMVIHFNLHNNLFFFLIYHLLHVIFNIYVIVVPTPKSPRGIWVFFIFFYFFYRISDSQTGRPFWRSDSQKLGGKKIRGCDVERTVRSQSSRRPLYLGVGTPKKGVV
jgi:hypothetical protein